MKYKIKQWEHRAWPLYIGLWFNKTVIRRSVIFYPSCKYDLRDDDQNDTNKLFGIGYFWDHHKESARFGWRYDNADGNIILSAYCYVSGDRVIKEITRLKINQRYFLTIEINPGFYEFHVKPDNDLYPVIAESVEKTHKKRFGFPLGFYFGGNRTCDHDIKIEMKKT